jgi:hypothetical protein
MKNIIRWTVLVIALLSFVGFANAQGSCYLDTELDYFNGLSFEDKEDYFRDKITLYLTTHFDISLPQADALNAAYNLADADNFKTAVEEGFEESQLSSDLEDVLEMVQNAGFISEDQKTFAVAGSELLANQNGCRCSRNSWFNMSCSGTCHGNSGCTIRPDGCGFLGMYSCNGMCYAS